MANCSLTENINRCRVCVFHSQSYMAVYGYSTYSSYTTQWTWKYSQLYCINFSEQTLTVQLHIRYSYCSCYFKSDVIFLCVCAYEVIRWRKYVGLARKHCNYTISCVTFLECGTALCKLQTLLCLQLMFHQC